MLSSKYETADVIPLDVAIDMYKEHGTATVVTDGKYIQLGEDEKILK